MARVLIDKKKLILLGKKVKELRLKANLTQSQLAFEADMNVTQLARIERGEINTGVLHIFKIAEVLEISPKKFFDNE